MIARVADFERRIVPVSERSRRLSSIIDAVALEEQSIVDSLDVSDTLEAQVRNWFQRDLELAQRFLAEQDSALVQERAEARDSIEAALARAMMALQARADSIVASTGTLPQEAGNCDGAVLVRSAVLEACTDTPSPVCEAARDTTAQTPYRFVDAAEQLWDLEELRAWSRPGPLRVGPPGQLVGARTVGLTR
ncbi:MAG TPA: hypothetical protein VFQ22_01380, partial [Longimicrobiales bacterium]|nr:hypothetical protein [Longimicrobiales bacterium]